MLGYFGLSRQLILSAVTIRLPYHTIRVIYLEACVLTTPTDAFTEVCVFGIISDIVW